MINFKRITVKELIENLELSMKKLISFLALFSICLGWQQGFSDEGDEYYDDGYYASKEPLEGPPIYVHDVPSYSYRFRCEEKEIPVRRLCCRPVQRQYEVQRVKYIPQWYTETITRTEVEYYYVDSVDIRQNWVCDKTCEFVPEYYRCPKKGENEMTPSRCDVCP